MSAIFLVNKTFVQTLGALIRPRGINVLVIEMVITGLATNVKTSMNAHCRLFIVSAVNALILKDRTLVFAQRYNVSQELQGTN